MKRECFLVFFFGITCYSSCNLVIEAVSFVDFFDVSGDGSKITWAHAVNSRNDLIESLNSNVMMLETDISWGYVEGNSEEKKEPIMAHPPKETSDINLNDWLDMVINYNGSNKKGIKLDFKFLEVLEDSFRIIQSKQDKINFPMIINADILTGPIDPLAQPVNSSVFLQLCKEYFPSAILSPGWTTSISPPVVGAYTWSHVLEMVKTLREADIVQDITFPIRGPFIITSIEPLIWLHDVVPNSSFTVWVGVYDTFNINDLILFRQMLPSEDVYFDLLKKSDSESLEKGLATKTDTPIVSTCANILQMPYFSSGNCVIAGSSAIVLSEVCTVTFSFPLSEITKQNGFVLKGVFEFLLDASLNRTEGDSVIVVSFGQLSQLYVYAGGLVRVYTDRSGWQKVQDKGNSLGFEISVADVSNANNLDTVVKLYPHSSMGKIGAHQDPAFHEFNLKRMTGKNIVFQILTYGRGIKIIRQLETLCIQSTSRAICCNCPFSMQIFALIVSYIMYYRYMLRI